ncbi:RNA-binding S4 domain-containing protein [Parvibium lacunae]|uniref:RNA-binding S4 domain-containing protein n=1 Tax=Parvibium lacunae TaxID=1888893 RepID=A0A368L0P9_9BURK|nr:S4 domain-containing protein [Parvibium lacunae]RCS57128.1 RNA-binding S4 domain-containing protein [Parvibium lacunae]
MSSVRLDKWLWAARFFKTRSLATQAIDGGKIFLNDERPKPAKEIKLGDRLKIRIGPTEYDVFVRALSDKRGPAPEARLLYEETVVSMARRHEQAEQRRLAPEPMQAFKGRPTKRDRRVLQTWNKTHGE